MKIIHCADLHLDSRMTSHLDKETARFRRGELLDTYMRMITYAVENGVSAILISGDLFDVNNISSTALHTVQRSVTDHPDIRFYYLKGNHDKDSFINRLTDIPDNLKLFHETWTSYEEADGKVRIYGMELTKDNSTSAGRSLIPDPSCFNIVMLHGQEAESTMGDKAEVIDLKAFRNRNIDYMALGHLHSYRLNQLDARGMYCYPGCLEGRGFDECGEHGFVLLDIDEETCRATQHFIPIACRTCYAEETDVTGLHTTQEMIGAIAAKLDGLPSGSLVKIILTGDTDVECEKDTEYILAAFRQRFYYVKLEDRTKPRVNYEDYANDRSLKGEFVRMVLADPEIEEDDKTMVIRYGLAALSGEEVLS